MPNAWKSGGQAIHRNPEAAVVEKPFFSGYGMYYFPQEADRQLTPGNCVSLENQTEQFRKLAKFLAKRAENIRNLPLDIPALHTEVSSLENEIDFWVAVDKKKIPDFYKGKNAELLANDETTVGQLKEAYASFYDELAQDVEQEIKDRQTVLDRIRGVETPEKEQ